MMPFTIPGHKRRTHLVGGLDRFLKQRLAPSFSDCHGR